MLQFHRLHYFLGQAWWFAEVAHWRRDRESCGVSFSVDEGCLRFGTHLLNIGIKSTFVLSALSGFSIHLVNPLNILIPAYFRWCKRVGEGSLSSCLELLLRACLGLILIMQGSVRLSHSLDVKLERKNVTAGHLTDNRRDVRSKRVLTFKRVDDVRSNCVSGSLETSASASILSRSPSCWLTTFICLGLSHLVDRHQCLLINSLVMSILIILTESLFSLVLHLVFDQHTLRNYAARWLGVGIQVNGNYFCFDSGGLFLGLNRSIKLLLWLFLVFFRLAPWHLELIWIENFLSCFNHGVSNCFLRGSRRYRGSVSLFLRKKLFLAGLNFVWILKGCELPWMIDSLIGLDISFRGNV